MFQTIYVISIIWMIGLIYFIRSLSVLSDRTKKYFQLVLFVTTIWGATRLVIAFLDLGDNGLLFSTRILLSMSVLIPYSVYLFASNFAVKSNDRKQNPQYLSILTLIIISLTLSNFSVVSVQRINFSIVINEYNLGYIVLILFELSVFIAALIKIKRSSSNNIFHDEITSIILRAVAITVVLIFGISVIPELVYKSNIPEYLALAEFPATSIAATYVIFKLSRLIDTRNTTLIAEAKLKDEFIAIASHQLRTPITMMKGSVSLLDRKSNLTKSQRGDVEDIKYGVERMEILVNQLMNVSLLDAGESEFNYQTIDLSQLVANEVQLAKQAATDKSITLRIDTPKQLFVRADKDKLSEVISGFVDNAIHYSPKATTVRISLRKYKDKAELRVSDQGIGIPKKEQKNLFSKFVRASNAKQRRPDGTGLGLYIAKKIIESHGGEIIFSSKEGKGSTFGFRLPVVKESKKQVS